MAFAIVIAFLLVIEVNLCTWTILETITILGPSAWCVLKARIDPGKFEWRPLSNSDEDNTYDSESDEDWTVNRPIFHMGIFTSRPEWRRPICIQTVILWFDIEIPTLDGSPVKEQHRQPQGISGFIKGSLGTVAVANKLTIFTGIWIPLFISETFVSKFVAGFDNFNYCFQDIEINIYLQIK